MRLLGKAGQQMRRERRLFEALGTSGRFRARRCDNAPVSASREGAAGAGRDTSVTAEAVLAQPPPVARCL